jgi:hypothetical protein
VTQLFELPDKWKTPPQVMTCLIENENAAAWQSARFFGRISRLREVICAATSDG